MKINKKKPGLPYFQEQTPISILNNDDTIFQKMAKNWMWSSVKRVHLITPTIRVRILLTNTVINLEFVLEKTKNKQKKRPGLTHF